MSLIKIGQGPASYNYYLLRGIIDDNVIKEARAVANALPEQGGLYSKSGANRMYAYLDQIPSLVALLPQLFDDLHIVGSNYFVSKPTDKGQETLGEWHTGHSLYFGVRGAAMTLWIPLQDLNEDTGGRLKMYNGRYISQMDDLLKCHVQDKGNSISNQHSILNFLNHELDEGCSVENMRAGDALVFDEMLPHQAERCLINREVLAVRLVLGDYALDRPLIEKVLERYKTVPGEISYAAEYLENLLKYGEYKLPGTPERAAQEAATAEGMPEQNVSTQRSLWQRAKGKLTKQGR
ncbi:MAG: hypothetical protein ACI8QS_002050 [Planctomycetota bacterium]|jgi:hypothetical protein